MDDDYELTDSFAAFLEEHKAFENNYRVMMRKSTWEKIIAPIRRDHAYYEEQDSERGAMFNGVPVNFLQLSKRPLEHPDKDFAVLFGPRVENRSPMIAVWRNPFIEGLS